ncbi:MAG: hypothetical protein ABFC96_09965 [Thermoguttaceae bacterium]
MNRPSNETIERVAREVLAELQARLAKEPARGEAQAQLGTTVPSPRKAERPSPEPPVPSPEPAASSDALALAVRLVTMNEVSGRLDGIRRVVVGRGAIVTPAVTDELLRRGIALEYADAPKPAVAGVRLVLVVARTEFDPASLAAALTREGFVVEPSVSDCLVAATDQLVRDIANPATLGVLITRHTAAGVCLANRQARVRAIHGVDAPSVASAAAAVGANVLVVDPRAATFFQLKQMITEFGRGGVRPCPEALRQKLA